MVPQVNAGLKKEENFTITVFVHSSVFNIIIQLVFVLIHFVIVLKGTYNLVKLTPE